ncbi:MAG: hypothetical protein JRJ04_16955, partial [Deltaproteobacteria bacterium]|nr:hypothetical protein [Deltaproteobacteria bacterium]
MDKTKKNVALRKIIDYGNYELDLLKKIRHRQDKSAEALGEMVWTLPTVTTSPFVTGVGMEHPLENGFAFLSPYGLPYLPGSSVKGVLRKAAEELALMEDDADRKGWDIFTLWRLFG